MKYIRIIALVFYSVIFAGSIQAQAAEGAPNNPVELHTGFTDPPDEGPYARPIDYPKIDALMQSEKWREALQVLRSYSINDDIYFTDYDDAPHHYRTPKRRVLIAQCLAHLGKSDEARKELHSMFEVKLDYPYRGWYEVLPLLIDLETARSYAAFEVWLNNTLTAPEDRDYRDRALQLMSIKKEMEAGHYETGLSELNHLDTNASRLYRVPTESSTIWHEKAKLSWYQAAVLDYFKRDPQGLAYLLQKLDDGQRYWDANIFYCAGEIASAAGATAETQAIPILRKASRGSTFIITREAAFALAKCGDKAVIPILYDLRQAPEIQNDVWTLYIQQYINTLLSKLAGTSFGEIKTHDDASRIFDQWRQWIDTHPVEK